MLHKITGLWQLLTKIVTIVGSCVSVCLLINRLASWIVGQFWKADKPKGITEDEIKLQLGITVKCNNLPVFRKRMRDICTAYSLRQKREEMLQLAEICFWAENIQVLALFLESVLLLVESNWELPANFGWLLFKAAIMRLSTMKKLSLLHVHDLCSPIILSPV